MSSVDTFLDKARSGLSRVRPQEADKLRHEGALLIDIRPHANRAAEGEIPGALPVERIHLEWRLSPDSRVAPARRHRRLAGHRVLQRGLRLQPGRPRPAAARLPRATDLVGGYRAWAEAGLPTEPGGRPALP